MLFVLKQLKHNTINTYKCLYLLNTMLCVTHDHTYGNRYSYTIDNTINMKGITTQR